MLLTEMITNLRVELQDLDPEDENFNVDLLKRAINKSVSLMSRLSPRRRMIETTISRDITGETLTISSGTGTLAYKPVKLNSLSIPNYVLDTDYTINYLTGVVTSIGANLPDDDYTVSYNLDPLKLDISTLLPDYIRIERVEYPAGNNPPSYLTYDVYENLLSLRGESIALSTNKHLRIIYLAQWTPPTDLVEGDYPSHLDDAVIIGSAGEASIFKAEHYVALAAGAVDDVASALSGLSSLTLTLNTLTPPTPPTLNVLVAPSGYTVQKPTAPTLGSPPSAPSLSSPPAAPSAPSLSFTNAETALGKVATLVSGVSIPSMVEYLKAGDDLINEATRGADVGKTYADYARVTVEGATAYINEAIAWLKEVDAELQKYAGEVTSYGSEVNGFANEISGDVGLYREQINAFIAELTGDVNLFRAEIDNENLGVNNASTEAQIFQTEVQDNLSMVELFRAEVQLYQAEVMDNQNLINEYIAKVNAIINQAGQLAPVVDNCLNVAGRYLASGQAKVNEMLAMMGVKAEFKAQTASSEQRS